MTVIDLETFARQEIAADRYPADAHFFTLSSCDTCRTNLFSVVVEHHTGSVAGNFRGLVHGRCANCGTGKTLLRFSGDHRRPERDENPQCSCSQGVFMVGRCERYERDEEQIGFFDEGVLVGQCAACGRKQVFVFID